VQILALSGFCKKLRVFNRFITMHQEQLCCDIKYFEFIYIYPDLDRVGNGGMGSGKTIAGRHTESFSR